AVGLGQDVFGEICRQEQVKEQIDRRQPSPLAGSAIDRFEGGGASVSGQRRASPQRGEHIGGERRHPQKGLPVDRRAKTLRQLARQKAVVHVALAGGQGSDS